jgi:hypothetical protein
MHCFARLAAPIRCPICRADLTKLLPDPPRPPAAASPLVSLSVTTQVEAASSASDSLRSLIERVRNMEFLENAVMRGAAPRNTLLPPPAHPRPSPRVVIYDSDDVAAAGGGAPEDAAAPGAA